MFGRSLRTFRRSSVRIRWQFHFRVLQCLQSFAIVVSVGRRRVDKRITRISSFPWPARYATFGEEPYATDRGRARSQTRAKSDA